MRQKLEKLLREVDNITEKELFPKESKSRLLLNRGTNFLDIKLTKDNENELIYGIL